MAAALRRLFHGPEVERVRPEPEPPPPPPWGGEARRCPQHGGERTNRGGAQEQPPYPAYGSQYWNSSPRMTYSSPYPAGPELQGQTQGFPVPPYPYGDCNHSIPQQRPPPPPPPPPPSQPRQQDPTWRPPGIYGAQPPYGWSAASTGNGNRYLAESSPPWPPCGTCGLHSPNNNAKESYNQLEQGTNQHSYYPEANHLPSGTMNDYKSVPLDTKPSVSNPKVQYSAEPQLYENVHKKQAVIDHGQGSNIRVQPSLETFDLHPGIQKVIQVMEGIEQLEEEVDEFVGKKTDKDYWLLEEMLTKKLLELDSIETGGQDNVRQARKEAVHRIQATLEELERKGL
ncbi:BAG family molecular chaperone regulator 4 isoform X2 [Anolis carolinensis]|uniref:BAG family molecular chaperone regulator 4 isoform X2 n=1 Tax=Anolis carolinensis TaxID=28377 RepID=UPI000462D442|nr:PREDICTED: BAG family molecular chaperone regulator 4 isoform X3 [Anolis carolinensis]|eukprot:XP_008117878.1 PREDICTED: BAG family molecular chaperone regulator 4 isoform X3 [Anolis carolinensis]